MRKDGTWGDHVCLTAASLMLNVNIRVISGAGLDHTMGNRRDDPSLTIVIGYITDLHYTSLVPLDATSSAFSGLNVTLKIILLDFINMTNYNH